MKHGLILTGTIVSQRVDQKEWEGKKYSVQVVGVSDGERTYGVSNQLKDGEQPKSYQLFKPCTVSAITYAATEKGNITLRGTITQEG